MRRAEPRPRRERLDLDEHWPRSLHQRGHRGARDAGRPAGEEGGGGVRHGLEPRARHREHADLVHRPEAVLHRPQQPVVERALALEVQHRVHDVLERLGTGDAAPFRHVADQQHRRPRFLGEPHEPGGRLAHLAHVPWRSFELLGISGLDRVDEHDAAAERPRVV